MEQPANQPSETPTPRPPITHAGSTYKNILIGLFIGILVGIAGLLYYQGYLTQIMRALYTATWVVFGVVILTFIIFWGLREYVTRYIFGSGTAGARDVLDEAQQVSDLLTGSLADRLLTDVPAEQRERIKYLLPRLANWLLWGRLRNWWWQWILGIFVSLGGITGTMLLMNQNELIQRQMMLEEASRRSALVVLMSNIMDKVDREIETQKIRNPQDSVFSLSQSLIGQMAALSYSFKPYRYLDGDTLISRPLSPERGQLLITITRLPLDRVTLSKIYLASIFRNADLQGVNLSEADLREADLSGAILREADLSRAFSVMADLSRAYLVEADLSGAQLSRADLREANLLEADLHSASLDGADLGGTSLLGADLGRADLRWADLNGADLRWADLREANLRWANLSRAHLGKTDLRWANLRETNLWEANLSIAQAQTVESLYDCINLHDSIRTPLLKTHPQLFKDPDKK